MWTDILEICQTIICILIWLLLWYIDVPIGNIYSGIQQICTVTLATLSQEQMVDLLKTSMNVTVTVVPPHPDGAPRRCVKPVLILWCCESICEKRGTTSFIIMFCVTVKINIMSLSPGVVMYQLVASCWGVGRATTRTLPHPNSCHASTANPIMRTGYYFLWS